MPYMISTEPVEHVDPVVELGPDEQHAEVSPLGDDGFPCPVADCVSFQINIEGYMIYSSKTGEIVDVVKDGIRWYKVVIGECDAEGECELLEIRV